MLSRACCDESLILAGGVWPLAASLGCKETAVYNARLPLSEVADPFSDQFPRTP